VEDLPLSGVRVVTLEQAIAAPLCTRYLYDLGADVIKVERPDGGDFARAYDRAAGSVSSWFVWTNRGKRSLALDLKSAEGPAVLEKLLARSDVFVHNLAPGAVERLGFGHAALRERYPRLITCAISGYGDRGPYRDRKAFDLLLQGEAGAIAVTGTPEAPAKIGISISDISAGMFALSSILAALLQRGRDGRGRHVEVSMLETTVEWLGGTFYYYLLTGQRPRRAGLRHATIVPYGPFAAKDGLVNLAVQNEAQWTRLCATVLRRPDLATDPRYASNADRLAHRAELEALIERILADLPVAELEGRLERADIPFGRLNELDDVATHPQLLARNKFVEVRGPEGQVLRVPAHPFGLEGLPERAGAVPALGQHTAEILADLASGG
jgi:crotonobetainyl-CoA:carnitine CoA-transferase CaiB-like acyl-CoA transferase